MAKANSRSASRRNQSQGDWREIADDREKYQAYLCSREWSVLKEAVRKRAGGKCERCKIFDINAVHHLTYERKYAERPEDLQGYCKWCHDFTHGKFDWDPAQSRTLALYVWACTRNKTRACPRRILNGTRPRRDLSQVMLAIDTLWAILRSGSSTRYLIKEGSGAPAVEAAIIRLNDALPFDYLSVLYLSPGLFSAAACEYDRITDRAGIGGDEPSWYDSHE